MNPSGDNLNYLVAFLGGIASSFTPCVYPLIPVTLGLIGIRTGSSRLKGLILSLVYVNGIAVTYSILGLIASLTGRIFGEVASSPITHILVGMLIILFGVSMLDVFAIALPNFIKFNAVKKNNYFSIFILGLSSGLIISPCLTPVLGSILAYLATKKNIFYGASLLFVFAYGLGFILILTGTFSTILINLPKSGKWMLYLKRLFSFILIVMGLYFIFNGLMRL